MTLQDIAVGALCAWRENRGGGAPGMQSVLNVLVNRAKARGTTVYEEVLRPYQFSSMTAPGPEAGIGPNALNAADWSAYLAALGLAQQASEDNLPDITGGATSYYAASMNPPPAWAASMTRTTEIAGQIFFR